VPEVNETIGKLAEEAVPRLANKKKGEYEDDGPIKKNRFETLPRFASDDAS